MKKAVSGGLYGTKTYTYLASGNMSVKDGLAMTYGDSAHPHAVTEFNGNTYSYDESGNMTGRLGKTLVYDAKNRLIEVKDGDTVEEKYTYDYTGFRVKKEIYGSAGSVESTVFNINGLYELKKTEGNEAYQFTKFIYGLNGEIVAQVAGTTTSLGSIYPVAKDMYNWKSLKGLGLKIYAYAATFLGSKEISRYAAIFVLALALLLLGALCVYNAFFREEGFLLAYRWLGHAIPGILLVFIATFALPGCFEGLFTNIYIDGIYYFHPNHVGSVKMVTDEDGNLVDKYYYDPYGSLLTAHSSETGKSKYMYMLKFKC